MKTKLFGDAGIGNPAGRAGHMMTSDSAVLPAINISEPCVLASWEYAFSQVLIHIDDWYVLASYYQMHCLTEYAE